MLKRTITGLVILILTAVCIALRLVSPLFFDAFVLVLIYGSLIEFYLAFKVADKRFYLLPLILLPIGSWASFRYFYNPLILVLCGAIIVLLYSACAELIENAKLRKNSNNISENDIKQRLFYKTQTTMNVCVYPVITLSLLFGLNYFGQTIGFIAIILLFAVTMFTDVFAYVFGVWLGKNRTKLTPEISPKKSVVGTIFGFLGGIVSAGLCYLLFYHLNLLGEFNIPVSKAIILFSMIGVFGSLATQIGDLIASAFKRRVGIKDFGSIFPGHGGFTDRVDGLMIAGVLVYCMFSVLI